MTVEELTALGGLPHDPGAPGGPPAFEFPGDIDRARGVVHADPFIALTRFEQGRLVRFELRASEGLACPRIEQLDLKALVPALASAQTLRQVFSAEALVDALGPGARIARVVDAERGAIDVFRWDLEQDGRRVARFEASVAAGTVIDHRIVE
jgi:hypothetical protein